ncbi:MAG: thioredoxin-dependent thiol peroxidase [Nitriliruptoraceae bacterium]
MLEHGQQAPDFTLDDHAGGSVTLSRLRGSPVVVYFYPKSDTPGCTTQACGIRDQWSAFERAGARVLGISPDSVADQAAFVGRYDLPHTILADPDRTVIEPWGAWGERSMYGRTFMGVLRSTVLVDADGNVAQVWPKVQPRQHADEVLAAITELSG